MGSPHTKGRRSPWGSTDMPAESSRANPVVEGSPLSREGNSHRAPPALLLEIEMKTLHFCVLLSCVRWSAGSENISNEAGRCFQPLNAAPALIFTATAAGTVPATSPRGGHMAETLTPPVLQPGTACIHATGQPPQTPGRRSAPLQAICRETGAGAPGMKLFQCQSWHPSALEAGCQKGTACE